VEDLLHGAQVGGMRELHRTGIRKAIHVMMSMLGNDDFSDRVIEVVRVVACYAVLFGFIPPDNDRAVLLLGV